MKKKLFLLLFCFIVMFSFNMNVYAKKYYVDLDVTVLSDTDFNTLRDSLCKDNDVETGNCWYTCKGYSKDDFTSMSEMDIDLSEYSPVISG